GLGVLDIPVNVDHAWRLLEDLANLTSDIDLPCIVWAINLGNQRLQHRWSGRNFRYLHARAELVSYRLKLCPDALGNFVRLRAAFGERQQVDLDVCLVGATPQKIMTDQPVEVIGAGRAGIDLVVRDLGFMSQDRGERLSNMRCLLQGR